MAKKIYTDAELLKILEQGKGSYLTADMLRTAYGGSSRHHNERLKKLVKAGKLKVMPGKTTIGGTRYTLAEGKSPMTDYTDQVIAMSRGGFCGQRMHEDSPLEAPTSGYNRNAKLMSPATREKVLEARRTEIEAFAEDRGIAPNMVMAIAEAAMRLGRVPALHQYGFSGDQAKAIKHFVAGEVLNIAIEDVQEASTGGTAMGATVDPMQIGTAFMQRGPMVNADYYERHRQEQDVLPVQPRIGVDINDKQAYTYDDLMNMEDDDKKKLHPKMKKHVDSPAFRAHIADPDDDEPPYHKGKGLEKKEGEEDVEENAPAGTDAPSKKDTKLSKKLRKKSPAYDEPGEFDTASGGSYTPVKKVEWREAMARERALRQQASA